MVDNPGLLDYEERKSVFCYIVAKQLQSKMESARAKLVVIINDINDNPPKFSQEEYHGKHCFTRIEKNPLRCSKCNLRNWTRGFL